jgi:hypothetical protein
MSTSFTSVKTDDESSTWADKGGPCWQRYQIMIHGGKD